MLFEAYARLQADVIRRIAGAVLTLVRPARTPELSDRDWVRLMADLYPLVADSQEESARLGRDYYDSEREIHVPNEPRHDVYLSTYDDANGFAEFVDAMEYTRPALVVADAPQSAVNVTVSQAVTEVENGGRRTVLRAVQSDPRALGWARTATGPSTCSFCLMLISRGPVYKTAASAGDQDAFHARCDCKIVPVFDRDDWTGRDAFLAVEQLWIDTPGTGKDKVKNFRRAVERPADQEAREAA